jgi:hypothetical protein
MPRKRAPSRVEGLIKAISNPHDVSMAWTIASILLVFEALLSLAIIAKVPCTSTSYQFYKIINLMFKSLSPPPTRPNN